VKHFFLYDQDGVIRRRGTVSNDRDFDNQAKPGLTLAEGMCSLKEHKIVDGRLTKISEEDKVAAKRERVETKRKEMIIQERVDRILRQMAVEELKQEGKIDEPREST